MVQFVQAVIGGYFVAFRQGGEIEHVVHKKFGVAVQGHHGLADVDQLRGPRADDVDP